MYTYYRSIDLLVESRLLKFERPAVVLNLGVSAVLDVHGGLFTLCLFDSSISFSLKMKTVIHQIKEEMFTNLLEQRQFLRPS